MHAVYAVPFSSGWLIAWDSLRVLVIAGGLVVTVAGVYMTARTSMTSRMALTAGLFCFITSAIGTEIQHLGDHATYRLFFNLLGVILAGGGMWLARRET